MAKRRKRLSAARETGARGAQTRLWAWVLVLVIIIFVGTVRIRLLSTPLERDEGEYAYAGQLILQGIPPYVHVYNMKLPGIYAAYALIMAVFGQTHIAIRVGLLLVNAATIVLIFLLAERLFDTFTGVIAAAAFAIMSVNHYVLGMFAHATHFVALPAVGGLLLLLKAIESDRPRMLFWSGLSLGVAFLMKQHGIFFAAFGVLYLLVAHFGRKPADRSRILVGEAWLLSGIVAPFVLTCAILLAAGAFERFWFWTVGYAFLYATEASLHEGAVLLREAAKNLLRTMPAFWALAAVGLASLFAGRELRRRALFVVGLFLFSFLATCPGMYFRGHYFIVLLPAVAILAGVGTSAIGRLLYTRLNLQVMRHTAPAALFAVLLVLSVVQESLYLFALSPNELSRKIYGIAPFAESLVIGKYIGEHSRASDTIAVMGSEPQIYFYAQRRSATGHIYMYPLMGKHEYAARMQKELIAEVEAARPEYVVFVNMMTSWMRSNDSPMILSDWLQAYCLREYDPVGCVQMVSYDETDYIWGDDLNSYVPQPEDWVFVFRRKPGPRT